MTSPAPRIGSFCWNELATRDAAASKAFYSQLFGWGCQDREMPGEMGVYTMLELEGQELGGLYEMAGPQFEGVPAHWAVYVAVDDVDATVGSATAAGAKVLWGPYDVPETGRMAGFADPTGAALNVFQYQGATPRQDFGNAPGSFSWAELHTTETDAASAFYTGLFGWGRKCDDGEPAPYHEWLLEGTPIGGMMKIDPSWGEVPPNWTTYVSVADCDATVAKATELGARVFLPPMSMPGVGRFAMFQDPGGAALAVIALDLAHLK